MSKQLVGEDAAQCQSFLRPRSPLSTDPLLIPPGGGEQGGFMRWITQITAATGISSD